MISRNQVLDYEVQSSWWASWVWWSWGRNLAGSYFAWKVKRKYGRYLISMNERAYIKSHQADHVHIVDGVDSSGGVTGVESNL